MKLTVDREQCAQAPGERFDDPLFVRTPSGMLPTAVAKELIDPIEEGLARLSQAID